MFEKFGFVFWGVTLYPFRDLHLGSSHSATLLAWTALVWTGDLPKKVMDRIGHGDCGG